MWNILFTKNLKKMKPPVPPSLTCLSLKQILSTKATRDELKRSPNTRKSVLRNARVRDIVYERMGKIHSLFNLLVTPTNKQSSQLLYHSVNCKRLIGAAENKFINLARLSPSVTNHEIFRQTQIDIDYRVFETFANKTEKEWSFFFKKVTNRLQDPMVRRMVNENPHCALRVSSSFIKIVDHLTIPLCVEYDKYYKIPFYY